MSSPSTLIDALRAAFDALGVPKRHVTKDAFGCCGEPSFEAALEGMGVGGPAMPDAGGDMGDDDMGDEEDADEEEEEDEDDAPVPPPVPVPGGSAR